MVLGICGGIGDKYGVDPNIIRVFFVLSSVFLGFPILLYFLGILIPKKTGSTKKKDTKSDLEDEGSKSKDTKETKVEGVTPRGEYVTQARIGKVEDLLDENENVHYLTRGSTMDIEGGSGQSQFGSDRGRKSSLLGSVRAAFTKKRIVVKIPQLLGNDERTIPYRNISSINLDTGLVNKRITLRASGGTYHIEAHDPEKSECREIINFVRGQMRTSQTSGSSGSSEKDSLDRLEKLKELHEKGAVSDEEFEEKKSDLMEDI